jgi:hypothetical protein
LGWRWLRQKTTTKHQTNLTKHIQATPMLETERV